MANSELESCLDDWNDLEKEFEQLEAEHKKYQKKLDEMVACQKKCLSSIAHHRYRMKTINETLKKNEKKLTEEEKTVLSDLRRKIDDRKSTFREMEEVLPHKNGLYLSIILGQVNISLLNKADKYSYKQEYEKFKLTVSYVVMVLSFFLTFFDDSRWIDAILHFLLVWYYCTLTIRESILVVNGSRIKGWWLTHHFISTVCAGISLIWPSSWSYLLFRKQYIMFMLYISMLYVMQYYYQSGSLYRLKALGQRHDMDITVEGFMSWMWKGMTFLLPFLFIGYFFQMYNAYILFVLSLDSRCHEWQVFALAFIYLVLCLGNLTTTLIVIRQKINKDGLSLKFLLNKYRFNSQLKQL
ncbi:ion channel TACAN-like isoform X1 [Gigantopelta aegis]|uniref:ion channel TACAN-like isoform X1 n=1 Tax=Gigantopelta aegis TaxID=1735272 RepID=UPI001B88A0F4|nr:ion channel TACAN-like isoform X1 [Gigantopelta aegis]